MLRRAGLLDAIHDLGANERLPVIFSTELLVQTVLSGLMVGVLYALMALGITFIYSIVKTINWAMGEAPSLSD